MTVDSGGRPSRRSTGDVWPKWMWIAVPVLVVVVVAGLWWAIFSEGGAPPTPTSTPTPKQIPTQPTQAPTLQNTLVSVDGPTHLPPLATFTPPPTEIETPTGPVTPAPRTTEGIAIGNTVKVVKTGNVGLHMRSGPGRAYGIIKTLPEGTLLVVVGGPRADGGFDWWELRDEAGTIGWAAADYLEKQ